MKKHTVAVLVMTGAITAITSATYISKEIVNKTTYSAILMEPIEARKQSFYEKYIKRIIDIICATGALVVLSPVYLVIALLVKIKLGSPILFTQDRPGIIGTDGKETIFKMYKFRTMTDAHDENGNLLSDDMRLTPFGAWLRKSSLDELPEAINILNGTMSVIGPRPQLVRDMVFMTPAQRMRHTAKPGLSGLAQVNGRNAISWEEKLSWDRKYIENISLSEDIQIVLDTVKKALIKREGITEDGMVTAMDFGDHLLSEGKINNGIYDQRQLLAKNILNKSDGVKREQDLVSIIMPSYNTAPYIKKSIQSVIDQTYTNWELIIVDDCSTDNTDEVLAEIDDPRIRIFKNKTNSGAAISRNKALREAKGRWIAFLDSDDLWLPDKLKKQLLFMKNNGYHFSYTNYEEIDIEGNERGLKVTGPKVITKADMFNYCWPGCLTVMYDADVAGLIQIENIKKNNDYAMWLKVCKKTNCYLLDDSLAQYRKGRTGSISTHSIKTMIGWHYKLFHEAEKQNPICSLINTGKNLCFGYYKKKRYVQVKKNV